MRADTKATTEHLKANDPCRKENGTHTIPPNHVEAT